MTADARPAQRPALAGHDRRLPEVLARERVQEVILADPDFPQEKTVELVDVCHQRGVTVHVAPTTMEILMERAEFVPGQSVPLFMLRPPVFEGLDFALKRDLRPGHRVARACSCSPRCWRSSRCWSS